MSNDQMCDCIKSKAKAYRRIAEESRNKATLHRADAAQEDARAQNAEDVATELDKVARECGGRA